MPSERAGVQKIGKHGSSQGKRGTAQQAGQIREATVLFALWLAGLLELSAMYKPQRAVIIWSQQWRGGGRGVSQKKREKKREKLVVGTKQPGPWRGVGVASAPQCLCKDSAVIQD